MMMKRVGGGRGGGLENYKVLEDAYSNVTTHKIIYTNHILYSNYLQKNMMIKSCVIKITYGCMKCMCIRYVYQINIDINCKNIFYFSTMYLILKFNLCLLYTSRCV